MDRKTVKGIFVLAWVGLCGGSAGTRNHISAVTPERHWVGASRALQEVRAGNTVVQGPGAWAGANGCFSGFPSCATCWSSVAWCWGFQLGRMRGQAGWHRALCVPDAYKFGCKLSP